LRKIRFKLWSWAYVPRRVGSSELAEPEHGVANLHVIRSHAPCHGLVQKSHIYPFDCQYSLLTIVEE